MTKRQRNLVRRRRADFQAVKETYGFRSYADLFRDRYARWLLNLEEK